MCLYSMYLGFFLTVNVQDEKYFLGCLIFPIFLAANGRCWAKPTYEENVRVPPPHTHTHSPWVTVYDELLAR